MQNGHEFRAGKYVARCLIENDRFVFRHYFVGGSTWHSCDLEMGDWNPVQLHSLRLFQRMDGASTVTGWHPKASVWLRSAYGDKLTLAARERQVVRAIRVSKAFARFLLGKVESNTLLRTAASTHVRAQAKATMRWLQDPEHATLHFDMTGIWFSPDLRIP